MKYSKKFDSKTDYESYINSSTFVTPSLDACGLDDAYYHLKPITLMKCVYDVSNNSINTVLMDNTNYQSLASINKMYVDGEEVTKAASYQFSSTGLHTVHYDINVDAQTGALQMSFNGNKSIVEVTIPDKCRAFHSNSSTFQDCNNLRRIYNIHKDFDPTPFLTGDDFCFTDLDYVDVARDNPYIDSRRNANAIIDTSAGILKIGTNHTIIPGDVSAIAYCAFQGRTGLTNIVLSHNIKYIGASAFSCNSGLTHVTIPSSCTSTGGNVFRDCTNLTSVTIEDGANMGRQVFMRAGLTGHLDIPGSITTIGNSFIRDTNLTSVKVHEGTTSLVYGAFVGISTVIETIDLPSTITEIGISDPTLPKYQTAQGWVFTYMPSLQSVIVRATTPPTLYGKNDQGGTALNSNWQDSVNAIFYVPAESVSAYRSAPGWSSLGTRIQPIPTT